MNIQNLQEGAKNEVNESIFEMAGYAVFHPAGTEADFVYWRGFTVTVLLSDVHKVKTPADRKSVCDQFL